MRLLLKILKKAHKFLFPSSHSEGRNWKMFSNKEYANQLIYDTLMADKPCMVARFGSTEMAALANYIGVKRKNQNKKEFITGKSLKWWWEPNVINQMQVWSGFFPPTQDKIERFCDLMLQEVPQVDILGSWLHDEKHLAQGLVESKRVMLEDLEPFFCSNPWTRALAGKKVLVVHPFAETIVVQYNKRTLLFEKDLLPTFELKTIKAVQSVAGSETEFNDWFEALDHMKAQIDATDYDICIIGCGAYGFPLAAHVKRSGKKAIHMAGATQLLFGIKGKRWENYIVWPYMNLFNEHWVRPGKNEKPKNAAAVEGACYW
ncbi:GT-D fold domain-containing protein [Sediminicola luteus]|uniref:GT-D fold-like domain-containing protein n=1 Tax=Sediminicola luteus TaxID=319238 RepID=A0ABV2TYU2_9FLAO